MITYIQGFLIIIFEILCLKIFFETFAERRDESRKWRNRGIIITLMLLTYVAAIFLHQHMILKQIVIVISMSVLMILYVRLNIVKSLFLAVLYQGIVLLIDYFCVLYGLIVFPETSFLQMSLLVILARSILFLLIMIIRKILGKNSTNILTHIDWFRFICFPVFTIFTVSILATMIVSTGGVEIKEQELISFVIAMGLTGMNIFVFYAMNDAVKRERKIKEAEILRLQAEKQIEINRTVFEGFNKQRKAAHEFNHKIMCIEGLLNKGNYEKLHEYLKSLNVNKISGQNYFNTNNEIVDSILNIKFEELAENNIAFPFIINDLSKININDEDIVTILSNLLDNAIEACNKCSDKKAISFKFITEDDNVVISVENTYKSEVPLQNGVIQTSKNTNNEEHGLGIKNVIETVRKYDGNYIIKYDGQKFIFSIIIPQKKAAQLSDVI